jgi:hypothetical protein
MTLLVFVDINCVRVLQTARNETAVCPSSSRYTGRDVRKKNSAGNLKRGQYCWSGSCASWSLFTRTPDELHCYQHAQTVYDASVRRHRNNTFRPSTPTLRFSSFYLIRVLFDDTLK